MHTDMLLICFIGLQVNVDSVINKWKKLRQQYKTHLDNRKRSGTERGKKWKFFDEMNEICGHRATSTPVTVIDSSLQNESGGKLNMYLVCSVTSTESHDSVISLLFGNWYKVRFVGFPV